MWMSKFSYTGLDQGSALESQSHGIPVPNFGIGIGIGIDFSELWDWDWDWDRFFKILGLGLGLGSIFQNFGIGIGLGITNSGQNPKKSQESQEIPKVVVEISVNLISMNYLLFFFLLKFLIIMVELNNIRYSKGLAHVVEFMVPRHIGFISRLSFS